jgi:hypothetical protein
MGAEYRVFLGLQAGTEVDRINGPNIPRFAFVGTRGVVCLSRPGYWGFDTSWGHFLGFVVGGIQQADVKESVLSEATTRQP